MRKFHVEQPHYHGLKLAPRMLAACSEHHVSNPTSIARKRSIRFGLSEGSATFWSMQQLKLFLSQLISDTLGISASNCCVMTHCVNYFGAVDAPLPPRTTLKPELNRPFGISLRQNVCVMSAAPVIDRS